VNTEELETIKKIMLTSLLKTKTNQKTPNNQKARGNIF